MRVHELSKEINVSNKELVELLSARNSEIKTHMSSLTDEEVSFAKKHFAPKTEQAKPKTEAIKSPVKQEAPRSQAARPENGNKPQGKSNGEGKQGDNIRSQLVYEPFLIWNFRAFFADGSVRFLRGSFSGFGFGFFFRSCFGILLRPGFGLGGGGSF